MTGVGDFELGLKKKYSGIKDRIKMEKIKLR